MAATTKSEQGLHSAYLNQTATGMARLVLSSNTAASEAYAALSHCWGKARGGHLSTGNLNQYMESLSLHTLPQTFQDAVRVCRDLGIRYIWIDALCIIQDSREDWNREAPQMAEIYTHAFVTLATPAAEGDDAGFLRAHEARLVSPLLFALSARGRKFPTVAGRMSLMRDANSVLSRQNTYYRLERSETFDDFVTFARLYSRGWAFQERALSQRLIYFAEDQVYWQCSTATEGSHGFRRRVTNMLSDLQDSSRITDWAPVSTRWLSSGYDDTAIQRVLPPQENPDAGVFFFRMWNHMVDDYSACNLTYPEDKFMAISGLISRMCSVAGWRPQDYLAGHWRHHLPISLLWRVWNPDFGPANKAPSWSWAKLNVGVKSCLLPDSSSPGRHNYTMLMTVLRATAPSTNGAYGSFPEGCITSQCRLCEMILRPRVRSEISEWTVHAGKARRRFKAQTGTLLVGETEDGLMLAEIRHDRQEPFSDMSRQRVFFAPLYRHISAFEDDDYSKYPTYEGLLFKPTGLTKGQFTRVGYMKIASSGEDASLYDLVSWAFKHEAVDEDCYRAFDGDEIYTVDLI